MGRKPNGKMAIFLLNSGKKKNESTFFFFFFFDNISISTAGFKITDTFIFQELMLALWCSFYNNGTLTS